MCILGTITAAQSLHNANDLTTLFEARANKWPVNQVGHERVCGDEDVRPGDQDRKEQRGKL